MALYDSDSEDEANPGPGKPLPAVISAPPMLNRPDSNNDSKGDGAKDVTMRFLQAQIQRNQRSQQPGTATFKTHVNPVIDLAARNRNAPNMKRVAPPKPRPITDGAPLSFLPKAVTEDSFMLFGETSIKNEYQPALPNDYVIHKRKKEEREAKEKAAKEVAERLSREHKEEARKREKGAAFAPPPMDESLVAAAEPPKEEPEFKQPSFLPAFGKGTSRGLGVAASIMSKYGYKEGAGLGRDEQGISTALSVAKIGKNTGVIKDESGQASAPSPAPVFQRAGNTTNMMKDASKILLMNNMVGPNEIDPELENDIREEMSKCGQINEIVVHKIDGAPENEAVRIFVEFTNIAQAIKANIVMNNRFFAGRQVSVRFYSVDDFAAKNYDR